MSTKLDAIRLCEYIEPIAKKHAFHVALTGGCLYEDRAKGGTYHNLVLIERKDIDLIFYSIRQQLDNHDNRRKSLLVELRSGLNIRHIAKHGWLDKCVLGEHKIDIMFPEDLTGDYPGDK